MIEIRLKGKIVGKLIGDTYYTHRDPDRHFYHKGRGYPISTSVLNKIKEMGCKYVFIIEDSPERKKYKVRLKRFEEVNSFQEIGFDSQKCLPLKEFIEMDEIGIIKHVPQKQARLNEIS